MTIIEDNNRLLEITEAAHAGKADFILPQCSYGKCDRVTGYAVYDLTTEKAIFALMVDSIPLMSYFMLDNKAYCLISICESCGGFDDGVRGKVLDAHKTNGKAIFSLQNEYCKGWYRGRAIFEKDREIEAMEEELRKKQEKIRKGGGSVRDKFYEQEPINY